jgi:fructose-1,6-bisphosphatase/inositol monophosphatase family enzyme
LIFREEYLMPKRQPTLDEMSSGLINATHSVETLFHGLQVAGTQTPVTITNFNKRIVLSLSKWINRYDTSLITQGEKVVKKDSDFAVYLSLLDDAGSMLAGLPSFACAMTLLSIDKNFVGHPMRTVVYAPMTKHGWLAEKDGVVRFKNLARGCVQELPMFRDHSAVSNIVKVHIPRWNEVATDLSQIACTLQADANIITLNLSDITFAGGLVALQSGGGDAIISNRINAAELASVSVIISTLGGTITDISGQPIQGFSYGIGDTCDFSTSNGMICATSTSTHTKILSLL